MTKRTSGRVTGRILVVALLATILGVGYFVGRSSQGALGVQPAHADPVHSLATGAIPGMVFQSADRVYELRTYTADEDKLDDLLTRFRDHTVQLFEKHGMTNVAYWTPRDAPLAENTLIYVLSYLHFVA